MTMANRKGKNVAEPRTVVDDIRDIRIKLSEECGNDVAKLAAMARKAGDAFRRKQKQLTQKKKRISK